MTSIPSDAQSASSGPLPEAALAGHLAWAAGRLPGRWVPEPLAPDASPRRYVRLRDGGRTVMLMAGPDPDENRLWLYLGRQLWYHGLPLPRILAADLAAGRFLLEDLGSVRLDSLPPGPERRRAYDLAASALAGWHERAGRAAEAIPLANPPWDAGFALRMEWGYFLDGLRLLGIAGEPDQAAAAEAGELALDAASDPSPVLIHRDWQSRNLMLDADGAVRVIDWQGARRGPAAYDVASCLHDPYAGLAAPEREAFLAAYLRARGLDPVRFGARLGPAAAMRLMQACGAYASLSTVKGRPAYRRHLAPALASLAAVLADPSGPPRPALAALAARALEAVGRLDAEAAARGPETGEAAPPEKSRLEPNP